MRKTKLLICLLLLINNVQGQNDYPLLLHSGTMIPKANVEQFINEPLPADVFNGYYYRLLQFNAIPAQADKERIAQTGIVLMDYLPRNTFVAAIPFALDKVVLRSLNVRAVIKQNEIQKLSSRLLGDVPDYAKTVKGYVDVIVQYQKNISHERALASAAKYMTLKSNKAAHTIALRIPAGDLKKLAAQPWALYIEPISSPSTPDDTKGKSLHRSNVLNSAYASGYHYDGSGVVTAIADDGEVGPHIDFTGRMTNHLTGLGGTHGDMTSGILAGAANLDPTVGGMAPGAYLHIYDITPYEHIVDAVNNFNVLGTVISSTSYSQGTTPGSDCNQYTTDSEFGDQLIHDNPQLLCVFSAGNQGQGDCGYPAGGSWGTITGGYKAGKNVIACGNLSELDVLDPTSSRGPVSDGRIKPDICANGLNQLSTDENNTYQVGGGTSAASPGIAGICAQLYQAYRAMNGGVDPESGLIKASLLNGAEDLGNAGPDFTYGWGRVNAYRALKTLEEGRYIKDTISQGGTNTHTITVPAGVSEFRVMLYWMDPAGSSLSTTFLVNDLNMHVTDPISLNWNPWILDPTPVIANITAPAVRGVDSLNNMEQVTIPASFPGNFTVTVDGYSIPQGPQTYYIVYEFRTQDIKVTYPGGGEGFVPGESEVIRWDAVKGLGAFTVEYTTDNGANWNVINSNVNQNTLQLAWTVPATVTGDALVRVSRGGFTGISDTVFAIIGDPQNIIVDWACVDSIQLSWDSVPGAAGYTIYKLGNEYMDVVGTSTTNSFVVTGTNPVDEYWFSVSAQASNSLNGRRAYAINKAPGITNCPVAVDAETQSIISPSGGTITDCQDNDSIMVSVTIRNNGFGDISNFQVSYTLNGGTTLTETITDTIPAAASYLFTFSTFVDYSIAGNYDLQVYVTYPGDLNIYNDTLTVSTVVVPGVLAPLPFTEDFQSYALCGTANDCEATVCPLGNGWLNETNLIGDDIDFRVNAGGTPTGNTGPANDHTLGTAAGQYIYLEASGCFGKNSLLQTPCIDLTTNTGPELSFWYHMSGSSMGELHVDVYAGGSWIDDVVTPLIGNQGNAWFQSIVNLTAFAGEIIIIRFRAFTGTAQFSDIAIDDINIIETHVPPVPAFSASGTTGCLASVISFTDQSSFNPTTWQWAITPNTFSYINGTSATSQNPQVQFNAIGQYDVQLTVTNAYGSDSVTQGSYIDIVSSVAATTVTEPFETNSFPPASWSIASAGNNFTWQQAINVIGSTGNSDTCAFVNNFNYNNSGAQDGLVTLPFALNGVNLPYLFFDVSYRRRTMGNNDALRIDISTDCGANYQPTAYLKSGATLATQGGILPTPFIPTLATQWRKDSVDLSPWNGNGEVLLKFVNINANGNNLYIDNINIVDLVGVSEQALNADITVYPNPSSGIFMLNINGLNENVNLAITDVQGKVVRQWQENVTTNYRKLIDLTNYHKGIYFLELRTGTGVSRYRLSVI